MMKILTRKRLSTSYQVLFIRRYIINVQQHIGIVGIHNKIISKATKQKLSELHWGMRKSTILVEILALITRRLKSQKFVKTKNLSNRFDLMNKYIDQCPIMRETIFFSDVVKHLQKLITY